MALKEKQILKILKNLSENDICKEHFQNFLLDLEYVKKRFPEEYKQLFKEIEDKKLTDEFDVRTYFISQCI
jgi:hypothetical protein